MKVIKVLQNLNFTENRTLNKLLPGIFIKMAVEFMTSGYRIGPITVKFIILISKHLTVVKFCNIVRT